MEIDTSDFQRKLDKIERASDKGVKRALYAMANSLLADSREQVPLDKSTLMKSGFVDQDHPNETLVVYNIKYASYQHEGVRRDGTYKIKAWQGGRKGKYLEDPLHNKHAKYMKIYKEELAGGIL